MTHFQQPAQKARYIMIGGFLGAGKTTAIAALAQQLSTQGMRVGLITNDQGTELVDTAMLRSRGFATEEITGGCFCCRFNTLTDAARKLTDATRPDVFIAEPVGSCTDLVATVTYPLRRIYGDDFTIAPLSVLIDPIRAERVLGLEQGGQFSTKVTYIYRKQLEEADTLVVSKCELLSEDRAQRLRSALGIAFPGKSLRFISARKGYGLNEWFQHLLTMEQLHQPLMEVDYELYAEGEAMLGWLNATVQIHAQNAFDSSDVLRNLAAAMQSQLGGVEIAHLKMTLSPDDGLGDVAVINLVRSDFVPELSLKLEEPLRSGQLILNCRAEAAPETLRDALQAAVAAIKSQTMDVRIEHLECFRPAKPQPTYREG